MTSATIYADTETGEIQDAEFAPLAPDGVSGYVTKDPTHRPFIPPDAQFEAEEQEFLANAGFDLIARGLIERWPELAHTEEARIEYRWKRKGGESNGKQTFGMCVKLGGLAKHFAHCDFVIWIAADHLREMKFTNAELEALLYHELQHVSWEVDKQGITKWVIRGHDIETFATEIHRYGAWTTALQLNREAWNQLAIGGGQ